MPSISHPAPSLQDMAQNIFLVKKGVAHGGTQCDLLGVLGVWGDCA